jgi:type IV pilus assembly protein PilQ
MASLGALALPLLAACGSGLGETRGTKDQAPAAVPEARNITVTAEKAPVAPEPVATAPVAAPAAAEAAPAAPAPAPAAEAAPVPAADKPAAEPAPAEEAKAPAGPRTLVGMDVLKGDAGTVVTLRGSGPLAYEYFMVEGKSLVVDIADTANKVWPLVNKVDDPWISQIRIGEHLQPKKTTRVVFDLKKVGEYKVTGEGDRISVAFGVAALKAEAREGASKTANSVTDVSFKPQDTKSRLEIKSALRPDFRVVDSGDPNKVVIEITNARISARDQKAMDLSSLNREVVRITSFQYVKEEVPMVRVSVQLRQPVPFHAAVDGERIVVEFERATEAPAAAATAPAPGAPGAAPAVASAAPAAPEAPVFTGRKLSLDFKDADVNDILRLISEVSGLNFVAGTEVKGSVTIKLTDVPWDQALEIILKTNQPPLAQIREAENIIRITTSDKILDEEQRRRRVEEDKKKTVDAARQLEPIVTKSFLISYGDVGKISEMIKGSFVSDRGKVQADERTKTIIVQDVAERVDHIEKMIATLDSQTPGVLVEARIVEVNSDFGQSVGIQWNMQGIADPAHGNAPPFEFPNSAQIGGSQGTSPNNYMVNLPASNSVAGIGMTFGHIANTLSLDLKLSAMESMGKTKILSNPKVLVIQNEKAIINMGSQLPIPKTDSSGNRTVEWKDVGITLDVQPRVTNDKRIFMDIKIEKSSRGTDVQTTEGTMFSLNTQRATTKVLITDGETTVIGGIFLQETAGTEAYVPGLGEIPILGWLFKTRTKSEARKELMIFLTPRIVTL